MTIELSADPEADIVYVKNLTTGETASVQVEGDEVTVKPPDSKEWALAAVMRLYDKVIDGR